MSWSSPRIGKERDPRKWNVKTEIIPENDKDKILGEGGEIRHFSG